MKQTLIFGVLLYSSLFVRSQDSMSLSLPNLTFSINIYKQLALAAEKENLIFSPYSLQQALGMTLIGAREQTASQMNFVLGTSTTEYLYQNQSLLRNQLQTQTDSVAWYSANSLWVQEDFPILKSFTDTVLEYYQAPVQKVRFVMPKERKLAAETINHWVAQHTQQQLTHLIKPEQLFENTRLILVNASYFYAGWASAFKDSQTRTDTFYTVKEKTPTPFMNQTLSVPYYSDDLIQAVFIPYRGRKQSFVVLLPRESSGLSRIEETLDADYISPLLADRQPQQVAIEIPKIKFETASELSKLLQNLGMTEAFATTANFSGITGTTELKIDKVLHGAKIEVNEKGTEMAGATAVVMTRKSAPRNIPFNADHPFLFLVLDETTGTILFMGRLVHCATPQ